MSYFMQVLVGWYPYSVVSGYKSKIFSWLESGWSSFLLSIFISNWFTGVLSKAETLRICNISFKECWRFNLYFQMATSTKVHTAIQIWVLTALGLSPQNFLMRRCCWTYLKKISTFHLLRYRIEICRAGASKWLVRYTYVWSCSLS